MRFLAGMMTGVMFGFFLSALFEAGKGYDEDGSKPDISVFDERAVDEQSDQAQDD